MLFIQTNGKFGLRIYKIKRYSDVYSLFQGIHPESKILRVLKFYDNNPVQALELPLLGKKDEELEEGVRTPEEEGRYRRPTGKTEGQKDARQKWFRQKWKRQSRHEGR